MNTEERRWLLVVTLATLLVANLPVVLGFFFPPAGTVYTGIDSTAPGDVNVYLSYLEQVRQGHLVFRDLYTSEPQAATIFNPFWLVIGLLGSLLNLPTLATYFLARVFFGALLLLLIYAAATKLFTNVFHRRIAFLLAVFGSGLGAIAAPFINSWFHGHAPGAAWPMDLWVSEAFTFLSLHHSPHFLAATTLILLAVWWLMRVAEQRGLKPALYAGLAMLALFSFHPFHVVSLGLITFAFTVVVFLRDRRRMMNVLLLNILAWLVASPSIAYQTWLILNDPLAAGRAEQNILLTTWPGVTALSYGLLLIGAVIGARLLIRSSDLRKHLLVAWATAHTIAIYVPIFFNRRLTQGLNVALALLAAPALALLYERFMARANGLSVRRTFTIILVVFALTASSLWVFAQDLSYLLGRAGRSFPYYFYLDRGYGKVFQWLRANGDRDTVVLSAHITGNFIPGWSGRRVVAGHNVETVRFEEKRAEIVRFYTTGESDDWRKTFLASRGATHVIFGPWEARLGTFNGTDASYLEPTFASGQVRLYRVVP